MPMVLEAWPGGRWFRDLGQGNGHFWGHVQALKAPTLLEIHGPLFMSGPAMSNLQYRLSESNGVTLLKFTHRAVGIMPAEMPVERGWDMMIARIKAAVAK
jgi:Activator of Hsp90 ATPase homolog 1-like protein